jgi:TetR/AcrR family transcriptional regulator, transcriptional repressor for nem operon
MRYSKCHKEQTKQTIIRSACKLFAAKGFNATSIDEIMRDCNLTRGGFYAHFRSKSQLYHDAISLAAQKDIVGADFSEGEQPGWIEGLLNEYLDVEGTKTGNVGSSLAFLATDVASKEPQVRAAYASAFKAANAQLANRIRARAACSEATILSLTAMMIGTMAIAQTIDDLQLKTKLLMSCRENARTLLDDRSDYAPLSFFWEIPLERCYGHSGLHN